MNNAKESKYFIDSYGYWGLSVIIFLFFLITASPYSYLNAITHGFSDVEFYVRIAQAQDLSTFYKLAQYMQLHHLERWPSHFMIGKIALLTNFNVWEIYKVAVLTSMIIAITLIATLNCALFPKISYLTLILLNPYTYRIYYGVPAMFSDCIFYTSVVGFSVALHNRSFFGLLVFSFIACISRQTGILLIPILVYWVYQNKMPPINTAAAIFVPFIGFLVTRHSTEFLFQPTSDGYASRVLLGIFIWIRGNPNFDELFNFMGRFIIMLFTISPLLIIVRSIKKHYWFFIFGFLLVLSQPILGGPIITGGNVDRLAILGLPILGLILLSEKISLKKLSIFIPLIVMCSFHPHLTILSQINNNRFGYVILVLTATLISLIIFLQHKPPNNSTKLFS